MTTLRTARRGVNNAAIGMGIAVCTAMLFVFGGLNMILAVVAIAVGAGLAMTMTRGARASDSVRLIAMVNAFGGAAAATVAAAHLVSDRSTSMDRLFDEASAAVLTTVSVTPAVSVVALLLGAVVPQLTPPV